MWASAHPSNRHPSVCRVADCVILATLPGALHNQLARPIVSDWETYPYPLLPNRGSEGAERNVVGQQTSSVSNCLLDDAPGPPSEAPKHS